MSSGRIRVVVPLLAGFMVLALLVGGGLAVVNRHATTEPAYVILACGPHAAVWFECRGDEMRLADSPSALKSARATKAVRVSPRVAEFPWVDLPARPVGRGGLWPTQARFRIEREPGMFGIGVRETRVTGNFACVLPDAHADTWSYSADEWVPPGDSLDDAGIIRPPRFARLHLSAYPRAIGRRIGIGVHVSSHDRQLTAIRRNGRDAEVQVRLLDREGEVAAAKTAPLGAFEFT